MLITGVRSSKIIAKLIRILENKYWFVIEFTFRLFQNQNALKWRANSYFKRAPLYYDKYYNHLNTGDHITIIFLRR